jgi:hypothetical protein
MMTKPLRFRDVALNEPFDWIDPAPGARNSFFDRCYKTGPRTYRAFGTERQYTVGSINARVFHVGLLNTYRDR